MRLAFDTSTSTVFLGILTSEGWIEYQAKTESSEPQSKILLSIIQEFLMSEGIEKNEITEMALGIGPGSYTGLRVGMTVAKVWAYAKEIPLYTFSSDTLKKKGGIAALKDEDFKKIDDLQKLEPLYENDHFA